MSVAAFVEALTVLLVWNTTRVFPNTRVCFCGLQLGMAWEYVHFFYGLQEKGCAEKLLEGKS